MLKFLTRLLLLQTFFLSSNTFTLNKNYDLINKPLIKNKNIKMITNQIICPEYLEKVTNILSIKQSENTVKGITGFLTKVDGFGGYVLHMNDVLINYILNNENLTMETKKVLVLYFIQMSQMGDSTGSHILQFYHDLVNCLL